MSDTFFGFDTSLPAFEGDNLLDEKLVVTEEVNENEVDDKNEETFGGAADVESALPAMADGWQKGKGMSIKDILTQEYQKSNEVVSFEEEMEEEEIIENSISQLGLDDDVDEKETMSKPVVDDNTSWNVPAPGTPQRGSLNKDNILQDILSPDIRGIWTSPDRSEASSGASPQRSSEEKQPDLLKQIFHSANRSVSNGDQRNRIANVIKAEDLEKGIPSDETPSKDHSTPVIIERRIPRTPVAPPGFPFPIGTPPSGIPWIQPPGMMPFSPMMINAQMQRMLAASPYMGILGDMPNPMRFPRGMPPDMRQRMQGTPNQRGRYQRWGHGNTRFQGYQQRRQWHGNEQRHNYHGNQQRREWSNYPSHDDDVMKLPPSELMTSKEKEWLVKIQLMTLLTDDPQNKDYYYFNYMDKKATKMETEKSENEKAKSETDKENFNKLLDIVEQKREERKYRPAAFEGSLGKPTLANVHHPRKLVDVSSKEQEDEDPAKSKTTDGMKKRFNIYGNIEKAFALLLDIEEINRKLLDVPDLESDGLLPERGSKIEALFHAMKLSLDNWQKDKVNDMFVHIMCIPKGKRLFLRALQYFNKEQLQCAFLSILSNLQIIIKKDAQEKALLPLIELIRTALQDGDEVFVRQTLTALTANKLSQLFLYSFGLDIVASFLEVIDTYSKINKYLENKEFQESSEVLRKEVVASLTQISAKSRERHSKEISRIENLLQKPELTHAPEE